MQKIEQNTIAFDIEKAIERFTIVESKLITLDAQISEYYEPLFTDVIQRKDQAEFDILLSELSAHLPFVISVCSMAGMCGLKNNLVQHTNTSNMRKEIELFDILYNERIELNKQIREYYEPLFVDARQRKDKVVFDRLLRELPLNLIMLKNSHNILNMSKTL